MQDRLDDLAFPLFSWTAPPKPRFMRVVPDEITDAGSTSCSAAQGPLADRPIVEPMQ